EDDTRRGLKQEWRQTRWAWVMRPYPTPHAPSARVVLLHRVAASCRRENQHSEVGRGLRPDLKARLGRKRGAFRNPRSLPAFSTRRRTGIEPARELVAPSTVLKTAGPTRNPDASATERIGSRTKRCCRSDPVRRPWFGLVRA